jgi:hypothetical protein
MTTKKLTQAEFIDRCKSIHNDQYIYDNAVYINNRTPVILECKDHGVFEKNARALLLGNGCKKCNAKWNEYVTRQRMTTEDFINKAKDKHENFYSYEKSDYINSRSKLTITCPIHGDFEQQAGGHLEGYGCKKCGDLKHGDYRPWFVKTYFSKYPEKQNVPAILYLLYNKEEDFYKVGITTKSTVDERKKYISHYEFDTIDTIYDTMYNVAIAEQEILAVAEKYKPKKRFGGYSECIKNYIDIHQYVPKKDGIFIQEALVDYDIYRK